MNYKLVLENGLEFKGINFGAEQEVIGELFFSTSMVGYQEILSDPYYYGKIACMTYPLIGNYGLADDDVDHKKIYIKGYVVGENNDNPSNFRFTKTLSEAMNDNKVVGIEGIDTRELTRILRNNGTMKALICVESKPIDECLEQLSKYVEEDLPVKSVSCKKTWYSRTSNPLFNIVIVDLGINIKLPKKLNEYGLNVNIVPYNTSVEQIKKLKPNGIIISNGPGNPNNLVELCNKIIELKGKYPILGLGLGAQVIALSYGAKVTKMKCGHNGANQPVRNLKTNKIDITSQNHNYQIDLDNTDLTVTYKNVIDNDIEGFEDLNNKVLGFQYQIINTLDENENIINKFIEQLKK